MLSLQRLTGILMKGEGRKERRWKEGSGWGMALSRGSASARSYQPPCQKGEVKGNREFLDHKLKGELIQLLNSPALSSIPKPRVIFGTQTIIHQEKK